MIGNKNVELRLYQTVLVDDMNTTIKRKRKIVNVSLGPMECLLSETTKQVRPSGGQSVSQKTGMLRLAEPIGNEVWGF